MVTAQNIEEVLSPALWEGDDVDPVTFGEGHHTVNSAVDPDQDVVDVNVTSCYSPRQQAW
jgi:hypothetical protein